MDDVPGSSLSITVDDVDVVEDNSVMVIVAESERSSLSVAEVVMLCVPSESVDVENEAPLPMGPSWFETQDRFPEI